MFFQCFFLVVLGMCHCVFYKVAVLIFASECPPSLWDSFNHVNALRSNCAKNLLKEVISAKTNGFWAQRRSFILCQCLIMKTMCQEVRYVIEMLLTDRHKDFLMQTISERGTRTSATYSFDYNCERLHWLNSTDDSNLRTLMPRHNMN